MRYIAVVSHGSAGWVIHFPDFPDLAPRGLSIQMALRRARGELAEKAEILRIMGMPMPKPMRPDAVIRTPGCSDCLLAIIAVPEPAAPGDGNLFQFGRA